MWGKAVSDNNKTEMCCKDCGCRLTEVDEKGLCENCRKKERWKTCINISLLALCGFAFIKKLYDDVCNPADHAESITEME